MHIMKDLNSHHTAKELSRSINHQEIISPESLIQKYSADAGTIQFIKRSRDTISKIISGDDPRVLAIT